MNYKKQSKISEHLLNRIISVAYGSASFIEKYRINRLASKDERVNELLVKYKETAKAVHSIPKENYEGKIFVKPISENKKSIFDDIYLILIGKPVVSMAASILLIVTITFAVFNNRELKYDNYSVAEVQRANLETKQALMIVNKIFNKTEDLIKYDILGNEVSKPIKAGMKTVNKLFKKEIKNETREKKS